MPDKLPDHIELEPLPFDDAIAFFKNTLALSAEEFSALGQAARARAFTVSGVVRMDVIMDVHRAVEKAIVDGETLADFKNRLSEIMESRGWEGMTPWHTETVFRNNIQTAYNAGRYKQMKAQVKSFPYWEYDAVNDSATRPEHAALDGKVFPANHSFWDTWYPPNGHRCRCSVNPVHRAVAEAESLTIETEDPTGTLIEPKDPVTGQKLPARLLMPDPGWDHNPARDAWKPDLSGYPDALKGQFEAEKRSRS